MSFLLAVQFLTTVPVRLRDQKAPDALGPAMAWFSVVGLLIGGVLAGVDYVLRLVLPATVSAALLLIVWVVLTGALHLDGFLDCCDGLLGAKSADRRLEILRDSRVGAFAVVGGVCLLLLKYTVLLELPDAWRTRALVVIPALTRAVMVFAARAYPNARSGSGLGGLFRSGLGWGHVMIAGAVAVVSASVALGWIGVGLAGVVWVLCIAVAWLTQRRIPGLTGDVYGAINEITEVGAMLFLILLEVV